MPLSCFCFGAARPGSPGGEVVARAKGAGPGAALKQGTFSNDENVQLIGTAVAPPETTEALTEGQAAPGPPPGLDAGAQVAAEGSRAPLLGGDEEAASDGPADAADVGQAAAQAAAQAAPGPQQPAAAEAESGAGAEAAGDPEGSVDGPAAESSRSALLAPAEEVSLLQPRASRLSALLSHSGSGMAGDASQRQSKQQPTPRAGDLAAQQYGAALAPEAALLPRAQLPPLAQPEEALADAAAMLGRQAATCGLGEKAFADIRSR